MMQQEDLTRTLACALWRSAFSPYSRALDNWLAAEAMVTEALHAARQVPEPQLEAATAPVRSLHSAAFPVEYVRELAECFWQNSARSAALTLDIWLAAERHVRAFCETALAGPGVLQPFSAEAHWRQIRDHAEWLWHLQNRPAGRDLETWLEAEAEVLERVGADGRMAQAEPCGTSATKRPPLALSMPDEDGGEAVEPWQAPAAARRAGAHPGL